MGSQSGGGHKTPLVDWIAVYVMLIGCVGLGLALPLKSWWIGIAGLVVGLVGFGLAVGYGIMNHTEDYTVRPKDDSSDAVNRADNPRPQSPHGGRITSA